VFLAVNLNAYLCRTSGERFVIPNLHRSIHVLDIMLDQRQAQPGAAFVFAVKGIENAGETVG
jgi:hypothetical protein